MKLDHFVINVEEKYQKNESIINTIKKKNFPYEPKWGKGTKGFKVSNLWIGNEYLEMVRVLKTDGGGWIEEWTKKYNAGHRGLICIMFDVDNMDDLYQSLSRKGIKVTEPAWLEFKWFLNLLTRRMPWRNSYIPFFSELPLQIGFQEMKDEKSRDFMNQYMVPNSRENGIEGINKIVIRGNYTKEDINIIQTVFDKAVCVKEDSVTIQLESGQSIEFIKDNGYQADFYTNSNTGDYVEIENVRIHC